MVLMPSDYDKIREDNLREYGHGTRHLSFLGRLYTDKTHFIFELLQNAEDAGASKIFFHLLEEKLEVFHDGRPFDEKDVRGICGVGEGTKTEDLTQIGKFGIGFKSVYAYTISPEIYSGDESFKIEHYVRPFAIEKRKINDSWTTLFVFPFNKEEVEPATACREISARLSKLSARTLLFLRKIKEIEYRLPDGTSGVYLRDEATHGSAREVTVIGQNNGKNENESWLIFERPVDVPEPSEDCPRQVQVEIGFRLRVKESEQREEVVKIKDSPLVVFFPTEKETRLGFLIQGPYKTTPARDNIPKDDNWNATLVHETACLMADVLPQLKDLGLLGVSLLEALPIRPDDFPENGMFYPIFSTVREALKTKELLPADDGSFVSGLNAKLARGADLRRLLGNEQLCELFQSEVAVKYLAGSITQDRTPELHKYLLNELQIEEITPDSFARRITPSFLSKQDDEWLVKFYGFLLGQEALWRSPRWSGDSGGLLRSKPIIRLQDNSHVIPFRADGTTPNAFLPPPDDTDFPIVKRSIASNEQAKNFLKRLGLSEPDLFDDIIEKDLPKYLKTCNASISKKEHEFHIQKILRALASDSEKGKDKIIDMLKKTPFLRAVNTKGKIEYKALDDIYLQTDELETYFGDDHNIWFLAEEKGERKWLELGVSSKPRFIKLHIDLDLKEKMKLRGDEGHTRDVETIDYDLEGLEKFLLKFHDKKEERKKKALILWRFLLEHLKESSNYRFYIGEYRWFYYNEKTANFEPTWKKRLCQFNWMPKKDIDIMCRPEEISLNELPDEFERDEKLAIQLGMKKDVISKLAEEAGISLDDINLIKQLKEDPEEYEKVKSRLANKEKPAFPTRTSTNPDRRKERLAEQMNNAPKKEYEQRNRSVRTTANTIDQETYLRNAYTNDDGQMVCQICKEEMPFKKRDGEYYFEAVEALSRDHFNKEHVAQFLALCPLCAAMYKEFVKYDKDAMESFKNKLLNSKETEVSLQLGELDTSIRFVESHYHDIRTIIEGNDEKQKD